MVLSKSLYSTLPLKALEGGGHYRAVACILAQKYRSRRAMTGMMRALLDRRMSRVVMKLFLILVTILVVLSLWVARAARAGELPKAGQLAPAFQLPDQAGKTWTLDEFQGKWLVLYFYPKDDTPGCTQEACAFRDDLQHLTDMGAAVVGISVDDRDSHAEFAKKYHLPFPLLADQGGVVAERYGALLNLGILRFARRFTFLISPQGKISKVYLSVETSRHSTEIIADLKNASLLVQ